MRNQELKSGPPKWLYYALFTVSGFSGLIYESIWSHYLKLFLGHAAYAQSLVLSIFMGGMAIGAWLAGQYSSRMRLPILAYAIVEGIIGVLALVFHESFITITDLAYGALLPAAGSIALAHAVKWTIGALMILPQSILLGMTFPLMTAGIIRRYPERSGGTISLLYFTNSIGAAVGVLASGFWLIEAVGLPGTIRTAGLINLLLALSVWAAIKLDRAPLIEPLKTAAKIKPEMNRENRLLLIAALVTGMASFIYEIGWIRMLSLVLGSSTHAFELMLSAFITGLALGGLWIRKRIDSFSSPLKFAAYVQLAMGLLALLTLPLYGWTFEWMGKVMKSLERTEQTYSLLLYASHGIALAVMLPATFCAGMTLPLFTHSLLKSGYGEKSIGRIYAFNTAGSIIGVLLAANMLPLLGLKNLIGAGALLDIALGIALLACALGSGAYRKQLMPISGTVVLVFAMVFGLSELRPSQLASGVFRYGRTELVAESRMLFYRDGKTSSVSVHRDNQHLVLTSNGKPDASINFDSQSAPTGDESTMVLLAALPYGFKPDVKTVANIGLGSGLTTHTLLTLPQIARVDTIEIESAVVDASRLFADKVALAHTDPRSAIHIEDAKTFFSVNNRRYDLIISEPSNPWVSGVSSLYTGEFYSQIKRYLADDGVFAQWMHLYETDWRIITSVLQALDANFSDYALYGTNDLDILIVARHKGALGELHAEKILASGLRNNLARLDIRNAPDLQYRLLGNREVLGPFLRSAPVPANSDYFPYLDTHAHKAFFVGNEALEFNLNQLPLPVLEMLSPADFYASRKLTPEQDLLIAKANMAAYKVINDLPDPQAVTANCAADPASWLQQRYTLIQYMVANLDRTQATAALNALVKACFSAGNPAIQPWIDFYRAVATRDGAGMHRHAQQLLNAGAAENNRELQEYLLGAALLGAYTSRPQLAVETWQEYAGMFESLEAAPLYFRVMLEKAKAAE